MPALALIAFVIPTLVATLAVALSLHSIGAAEVGLVTKRLARRSLDEGNPVACHGEVLTEREIAKQEKATFHEQREAQHARIEVEKARGTADMQGQLASSQVSIEINSNAAEARAAQARGEAAYTETTARAEATKVEVLGRADAARIEVLGAAEATRAEAVGLAEAKAAEALGLARAEGFEAQRQALGPQATAIVAAINAIAEGRVDVMPEVLVAGGGSVEGLAASLIRRFGVSASATADSTLAPPAVVQV